jgi:hypothetical protein
MALIPVPTDAERRELHYGMRGSDVQAFGRMVRRYLKGHGYVPANAQNGVYGDGLHLDALRFQKLENLDQDGVIGQATWHAIDPQMKAYERWLLARAPKPKPVQVGVKIVAKMRLMLAWGLRRYTQTRPAAITDAEWKSDGSDCSGSALKARADAMGIAWNGMGYTGSMWTEGIAVSEKNVQLGDMIFYGSRGVTDHVAVVSDVAGRRAIGFGAVPGRELDWFYRGDFMGFRRLA